MSKLSSSTASNHKIIQEFTKQKNFLEGSALENSSGMTVEIISYPDRILHELLSSAYRISKSLSFRT